MTDNIIHFPGDAVTTKDGRAITTSLRIAEVFGKRHDLVLRDIRRLECPPDFGLRNFEESSYLSEQNKRQPMYELTKDGAVFLIMGYTGSKAAQFKAAYIEAFNAMEQQLQQAWLADELEPLFDHTGLPQSNADKEKAMRRQLKAAKALLYDRDRTMKRLVHYRTKNLSIAECAKLTDMSASTASRLLKRAAEAGFFRYSGQIVPGQTRDKRYPKIGVSSAVIPSPKKPKE